jgi:hypothetical protein
MDGSPPRRCEHQFDNRRELAPRADPAEFCGRELTQHRTENPPMPNFASEDPQKPRELAAWYRDYAERAHTPWVCEGRLQTAEDIERAAARLEARSHARHYRTRH